MTTRSRRCSSRIRDGRRIVDNVLKGLVFITSTHVALLGFILVATLVGFSQPLLPLQILWLELFIDLSTSVAFEREPEEPGIMQRAPRDREVPLLTAPLLGKITAAGSFSLFGALALIRGTRAASSMLAGSRSPPSSSPRRSGRTPTEA